MTQIESTPVTFYRMKRKGQFEQIQIKINKYAEIITNTNIVV